MSDFKLNDNSGFIFKNDRKTQETHPDYKGTINVDGVEKSISLWVKEGQKGKFFGAAISEPYKKEEQPAKEAVTETVKAEEDDLPF